MEENSRKIIVEETSKKFIIEDTNAQSPSSPDSPNSPNVPYAHELFKDFREFRDRYHVGDIISKSPTGVVKQCVDQRDNKKREVRVYDKN